MRRGPRVLEEEGVDPWEEEGEDRAEREATAEVGCS